MEAMAAGTIYRAEGRVEVTHKADAKLLTIRNEPPKAIPSLQTEIWIERVVPVGSVEELMRKGGQPPASTAKREGGESK